MSKDAPQSLPNDIATLQAMLRHAQKKNESLAAEIEQHQQTKETLAAEIELQTQPIRELDRKREQLEQRLALVLKQLYGQRRERFIDPDQLTLFTLEDIEALAEEAKQAEQQRQQEEVLARRWGKKRPGHGRRPLPDHLPREIVRHELTAEKLGPSRFTVGKAPIPHSRSRSPF